MYILTKAALFSKLPYILSDGWSSRLQDGYLITTAHYIDTNWDIQNRVLAAVVLNDAHTGKNIGKQLLETATEWQCIRPHSLNSVTVDNATVYPEY